MNHEYYCSRCNQIHSIGDVGHSECFKSILNPSKFGQALDFIGSAGAYTYISDQTQQYVRDAQVFGLLGDKFSNSGIFSTPDAALTWLHERVAATSNSDALLRFLEGHGAGEVDAMRAINGSLRGLFYRAEFIKDGTGHIVSNTPGVDLNVVNRFTGEIVEHVQVKSNWSSDPQALRQTIHDFLNSDYYRPDITLTGPQELIDQAKQMGVPNRLVVIGTTDGNRLSGERLKDMIENKSLAVEGSITFQGIAERVGQGAVIGAAVGAGISALTSYMAYRQGRMTGKEAFRRVGIDASKGAIVGGAMGGLSVIFPPGVVGLGIAVVVGTQLRRLVDIAYGEGAWKDLVSSMGIVEASLKTTANGIVVVEQSTRLATAAQKSVVHDLVGFSEMSKQTDVGLEKLKAFRTSK